MGLKEILFRIAEWCLDGISVPTADLKHLIERMDGNGDGEISLRELLESIKGWLKNDG